MNLSNQARGDGEKVAEGAQLFFAFPNLQTQRHSQRLSKRGLQGKRNFQRGELRIVESLPFCRYFTHVILCNIINFNAFHVTSEDPEAQGGHREDSELILAQQDVRRRSACV